MSESLSARPFLITPELMAEVQKRSPSPWSLRGFYYAGIGSCIFAAFAGHFLATNNPLLQVVIGAAAVFGIFVIMQQSATASRRWQLTRSPSLQRAYTISIDETGVRTKTELSEGWIAWRGILQVSETDRAILIFTQPGQAYPIPRSSFATADAAQHFAATAKRYCESARN